MMMTMKPLVSTPASSSIVQAASHGPFYTPKVGVRGVRLKKFEKAVADLLEHDIEPKFVRLPITTASLQKYQQDRDDSCWPFDCIHPRARVRGDAPGQLTGDRARRKEDQLRSMLQCVAGMIMTTNEDDDNSKQPIRIVDFCGGTGHMALPLALLFPHCQVIVVDLKAASLKLLHEKAASCGEADANETHITSCLDNVFYQKGADLTKHERIKRQCPGIPNLYTFHGSIETFQEDFNIGIALHACGEASDVVLRTCASKNANFCVSPCCVGKLHRSRRNPYVYHATSGNVGTIDYPQSRSVRNLVDADHWDDLCRSADYTELKDIRTPRNATRRTAKALLETDRLLFMEQSYGYETALTRMDPWECSPRHDILLGWHPGNNRVSSPFRHCNVLEDQDCAADIDRARHHLLSTSDESCLLKGEDPVDWTRDEEQEIQSVVQTFMDDTAQYEYIFPSGMRPQQRKLVHQIAEKNGLLHFGVGKKNSTRTVGVRKRRRNE